MFKNDVINCVREHLDKWYATGNHNETACQLVDEYEERIRADERANTKKDIAKECKYVLACGMGKKKSLEHLIEILEKE